MSVFFYSRSQFTEDIHDGAHGILVASHVEGELNNVLVHVQVPDQDMEVEAAADWDLEHKQELVTRTVAQVKVFSFLEHPRFYNKYKVRTRE